MTGFEIPDSGLGLVCVCGGWRVPKGGQGGDVEDPLELARDLLARLGARAPVFVDLIQIQGFGSRDFFGIRV